MKTYKPISTISYNSKDYLISILESLDYIRFWVIIPHHAESDGLKDHIHVYIEPSKQIDTDVLKTEFLEPCEGIKPLGCEPFRKSKFGDWYWYGKHDKMYLLGKGKTRKYHYTDNDFITNDIELFHEYISDNKYISKGAYLCDLLMQGFTPLELVKSGLVGFNQIKYLESLKESINESNRQDIDLVQGVNDFSKPIDITDHMKGGDINEIFQ